MIFTYDNKQHSFASTHTPPTMRRTHSSASLSSPTSSLEWCFVFKKLNLIIFVVMLLYFGYLLGCLDDGQVVPASLLTRGGRKYGSNGLQASSAPGDEPTNGEQSNREVTNTEVAPTPLVIEERPPTRIYAKGPVIYNDKGPATSINLIGERNSGTNWITDHLVACVSFSSNLSIWWYSSVKEAN
jgi:hypothetical protein